MATLLGILKKPEIIEISKKVHAKLEFESKEANMLKSLWLPAIEDKFLAERLSAVAERVNNILDIYPPLPAIEYCRESQSTVYKLSKKCISLCFEDMPFFEIDAAIAHEYCHYLQQHVSSRGRQWDYFQEVREGFARGIELIVAKQISNEKDNLRFSKSAVGHAVSELLQFIKKSSEITNTMLRQDSGYSYVIGTTAFLAAEEMHGTGIYRRLLKSSNPYRLLSGFLEGKLKP